MSVGAAGLLGSSGSGAEAPGDLRFPLPDSGVAALSPLQLFWRRFRQDRVALCSLAFVVFLLVVALAAPLIVKLLGLPGPSVQNPNLTDSFGSPLGPSLAHPFGVDQLGQDVASRVIYGTRVALEVGILGTAVATLIGVVIGTLAGFYRGFLDTLRRGPVRGPAGARARAPGGPAVRHVVHGLGRAGPLPRAAAPRRASAAVAANPGWSAGNPGAGLPAPRYRPFAGLAVHRGGHGWRLCCMRTNPSGECGRYRGGAGGRRRSHAEEVLSRRCGKIRLQPANSDMAPIVLPATDVKVQGRVIGVLRKY